MKIALNDDRLVMILEILIRRYGIANTLTIANFRKVLDGAPARFVINAGIFGDDLVLHVDPTGPQAVSENDLRDLEWDAKEEKESIH